MPKSKRVKPDGTFGWDDLAKMLDPRRVTKALRKRVPRAHRQVGHLFVAAATIKITSEKPFTANSALTIALKGSSTPLVRDGDLVGSLTFQLVDGGMTLRMGVNSRRLGSGRYLAEVLHNGATIRVTPRMRAAVFAALREKIGDARFRTFAKRFLGGPAKSVWIIPPRPFLTSVWDDPAWQRRAEEIYMKALEGAIKDAAGQ